MKHNLKITAILLAMFLITQFIGLYVVGHYSKTKVVDGEVQNVSAPELPYGMQTPEIKEEKEFYEVFPSIIIAFAIAVFLLFILTKFKAEFILKLWFFAVVAIALGISFNAFLPQLENSEIIALAIALPLAFIKIYRINFLVHNFTELFVYPGIAAVFVPILNLWTIVALLIIISAYDIWAVWHSGIMQKMAKYQINKLRIFPGFFVPYISKKALMKLKKLKGKVKKTKRVKVNIAILGGGDIIFPIITSGIMLKSAGIWHALFVIFGAAAGLSYLFFFAEKKKFYPAMPFITAGIFAGMVLGYFLL